MAWIKSFQQLERHPKLALVCSKTGWNTDETVGKLHRFWWWVLDFAEDGDLSRYTPDQFLSNISGKIPCEELLKILQMANFIENNLLVHDWLDYAGEYLRVKYHTHNPVKLQEIYKKHRNGKRITLNKSKGRDIHDQTEEIKTDKTDEIITSQIANLLSSFQTSTQEKIKIFWHRASAKNKSKVISDGRRLTLLTELYNSFQRCKDVAVFDYALEQANSYDAPSIGYVNAVIKNRLVKK